MVNRQIQSTKQFHFTQDCTTTKHTEYFSITHLEVTLTLHTNAEM